MHEKTLANKAQLFRAFTYEKRGRLFLQNDAAFCADLRPGLGVSGRKGDNVRRFGGNGLECHALRLGDAVVATQMAVGGFVIVFLLVGWLRTALLG